ncbi:MAG: hypothetical protein AMJ84_00220 [Acidithiobacillales bacterium SM23_46]|nr:MAG: hypothetical protein AMJ84_00220 [Acidithiobacillales bacterium SM23_46]KPL29019.1 MAG: hypothetical protein AMJ72_00230 [Acidithiobacillales bacterium SM1_46]
MAISVDPITGEIFVPRADMPIIQASPEVRQLDTVQFWRDLKDWEKSVDGIPWPDTQQNFPSYTISGFTYAQAFLIIPPYFVRFEDGQYGVALQGTNNNILDVAASNQVRILSQNSGGLIEGRISDADIANIFNYVIENNETFAEQMRLIRADAAGRVVQAGDGSYAIRDAADSKNRIEGDDAVNGGRDITNTDGT